MAFPLDLPPDRLADFLAERIAQGLPGRRSQTPVAPQLGFGRHFGPAAREAREAAVLLLLYPKSTGWHLPTILRPAHMKAHADQVGLPGGMIEAGESSQQTALREYEEELGATRTGIRMIGELSPLFVFVSNVLVRPHLALCLDTPLWRPSPAEVAEVIEVPVAQLLDPGTLGRHAIERRGLTFSAPHYEIGGRRIWGATCMMLAELAALMKMESSGNQS